MAAPEVRVKAHTRRRSGVDREAHKTWGELKTGSRQTGGDIKKAFGGIGSDLKHRGKRTKKSKKRGGNRRSQNEYYIRGVSEDGRTTSGVVVAHDKDEARDEFREKHPGYRIVQLNERE